MLVLSLGESDEYAHDGQYDIYLRRAADVDKMIEELWYLVQTDNFYKGKTTFIITTDHGRGKKPSTWRQHDLFKKGAGETWLAVLGAGIDAKGEVKNEQQIYQEQFAQTIATLMGVKFTPDHATGEAIDLNSIAGKQD